MQTTYLVECFWPGVSETTLVAATERARKAALELQREGQQIAYLDSILIPVDEIVFCLFDAPSVTAVRDVSRRAALPFERIVESVRVRAGAAPADAERHPPAIGVGPSSESLPSDRTEARKE
jgi:hypothetical protein